MTSGAIRHLYVHVPFCARICPYCDFHVLTRQNDLVTRYLDRLEEQAAAFAAYQIDLDTVYVGGGTPSFLRDGELQRLAEIIQRYLGWGRLENTLEINPGTVSQKRAQLWCSLGFDRASIGIQSFNDQTLSFLGRNHTAAQGRRAIELLQQQDMQISGDLITAVPQQNLEADVRALASMGIGHISAYTLTIESGTEFARRGIQICEEAEQEGFELTEILLAEYGFTRYEISNYAQPNQQSRHNLGYWQGHTYLGLGPGAAGHYPASVSEYKSIRRTNPPLHEWLLGKEGESDLIGPHDYVTDALFMGLRLHQGINLNDLSRRSGIDVFQHYQTAFAPYLAQGFLEMKDDVLRATRQGWWILNKIIADCIQIQNDSDIYFSADQDL